jgi:hypothetical protein
VPDEEVTGVLFNVARDFGRDLYGEFEARYDDRLRGERTVLAPVPPLPLEPVLFHSYDRDFLVRLTWEAYQNFTTSAEAGYLARSGDRRYDGEWLAFRFRYTF